ncbi:hypothetical protein KTH02_01865 [Acinetobacter radioresistens]|uniref:hypothetical protein n=1 Tax=Acinetobacter radioresistens TaxID=40216 RepID=UPI0021CD2BF2|nr:hypothetical protein [Acinetobacter radioresistens]MCU4307619.1 hypothetical protein [Acinetobacter radioresistens]
MWEYLHQIESLKIELSETKRVLHNVIDMEVEKNKDLKAQLECCRKENAVLLGKVGEGERRISFLEMNIKYVLDHFDMNDLDKAMPRVYEDLKEALRGKHE